MSRFLMIFDFWPWGLCIYFFLPIWWDGKSDHDTFSCFFFAYIRFFTQHIPMKNGWTYYDCFVDTNLFLLSSHFYHFNITFGLYQ